MIAPRVMELGTLELCDCCGGSGVDPDDPPFDCAHCNGDGHIVLPPDDVLDETEAAEDQALADAVREMDLDDSRIGAK